MYGRDGDEFAARAVRGQERADVDVRDAVAVGQEKGVVVVPQVPRRARYAAAGHGVDADVGQRDLPVGLDRAVVVGDGPVLAEPDRDVGRVGVEVQEVVDETVALVAQAEDEAPDAA